MNMLHSLYEYFNKPINHQEPIMSTFIQNLRSNKSNLQDIIRNLHYISMQNYRCMTETSELFVFCYYVTNSTEWNYINEFSKDALNNIDFYSPLAPLIIANVDISNNIRYISDLMIRFDILPTDKDHSLNTLILYDAIPTKTKSIIMLLLLDSDFLHIDIRKVIINILFDEIKNEFCPLL